MQPASHAPWSPGLVVVVVVAVAQGVKVVSINKSTVAKPANQLAPFQLATSIIGDTRTSNPLENTPVFRSPQSLFNECV